jgi:hypothetical protein
MTKASFSCDSTIHPKTPEGIRDYGLPMPPCTSLDIVFEHLQWGTWTHKCWAIPTNPADTEQGHLDAAFQSNALDARNVIMYQHDAHVFSVNKAIEGLYMSKEGEIHQIIIRRDTKLANLDAWVAAQKAESAGYWFGGRWIADLQTDHKAKKVRKAAHKEAEEAILVREKQFWSDSYGHRMAIVQLDHLVGVYFEKYMLGRTQECRDWAGYGVPSPEYPPSFLPAGLKIRARRWAYGQPQQ